MLGLMSQTMQCTTRRTEKQAGQEVSSSESSRLPRTIGIPFRQRRTADTLVRTFATKTGVLVMPEKGQEVVLNDIRNFLLSNSQTSIGEFTRPMLTGVLRVRRINATVRRS